MRTELVIADCLRTYDVPCKGMLHIGAAFCEEGALYKELGFERVIWVEASPEELERRQQVAADLGQTLVIAALADKPQKGAEFHVTTNLYSSSLLPLGLHRRLYPDIFEDKVLLVDVITGEQFLREHPEAWACNVLSVDVQGAELRVLQGFRHSLTQFDCIYAEVYVDEVYEGCGKLIDADALLLHHGFIRVETWLKHGEGWGDAFWMKRALL